MDGVDGVELVLYLYESGLLIGHHHLLQVEPRVDRVRYFRVVEYREYLGG